MQARHNRCYAEQYLKVIGCAPQQTHQKATKPPLLTKRVCEIDLKKILKPRVPTWLDLGPELLASFNQSIFIWYQQQQQQRDTRAATRYLLDTYDT